MEHPPGGGQVGHGARSIRRGADKWGTEQGARGMGQGNIYLPDETKLKYKN